MANPHSVITRPRNAQIVSSLSFGVVEKVSSDALKLVTILEILIL